MEYTSPCYIDSVRNFSFVKLHEIVHGPVTFRAGHLTMAKEYLAAPHGGYKAIRPLETRFRLRAGSYVPIGNEWAESDRANSKDSEWGVPLFSATDASEFFRVVAPRYKYHRIRAGIHTPAEVGSTLTDFVALGLERGYAIENFFLTTNGLTPTSITGRTEGQDTVVVRILHAKNSQLSPEQRAHFLQYHNPPAIVHTPPWGIIAVPTVRSK